MPDKPFEDMSLEEQMGKLEETYNDGLERHRNTRSDKGGTHWSRKQALDHTHHLQLFASRLSAAMRAAHLDSIPEFSEVCRVSAPQIYNYTQATHIPRPVNLVKMAIALQVDSDWLVGQDVYGNIEQSILDNPYVSMRDEPHPRSVPVFAPPLSASQKIAMSNRIRRQFGELTVEEEKELSQIAINSVGQVLLPPHINPTITLDINRPEPSNADRKWFASLAGERLRMFCAAVSLKKSHMAALLEMSDPAFHNATTGKSILSEIRRRKLYDKFGLPMDWLTGAYFPEPVKLERKKWDGDNKRVYMGPWH